MLVSAAPHDRTQPNENPTGVKCSKRYQPERWKQCVKRDAQDCGNRTNSENIHP